MTRSSGEFKVVEILKFWPNVEGKKERHVELLKVVVMK